MNDAYGNPMVDQGLYAMNSSGGWVLSSDSSAVPGGEVYQYDADANSGNGGLNDAGYTLATSSVMGSSSLSSMSPNPSIQPAAAQTASSVSPMVQMANAFGQWGTTLAGIATGTPVTTTAAGAKTSTPAVANVYSTSFLLIAGVLIVALLVFSEKK